MDVLLLSKYVSVLILTLLLLAKHEGLTLLILNAASSIERDVASKERILAKVLKLDSLCDGHCEIEVLNGKHTCDTNKINRNEMITEKQN